MEKQDEISYGTLDIKTFIHVTQYFQNQKAARENAAREDVPMEDTARGNATNEDSTLLPKAQSQQSQLDKALTHRAVQPRTDEVLCSWVITEIHQQLENYSSWP